MLSTKSVDFSTNQLSVLSEVEYNDYLQYQVSKQKSSSTACVAQIVNPVACISQPTTLGPWVMDSGASNHIFGNKSLLSNITYSQSFPVLH